MTNIIMKKFFVGNILYIFFKKNKKMPSIISTVGYVAEVNVATSTETIITRGIIACNRPKKNLCLLILSHLLIKMKEMIQN